MGTGTYRETVEHPLLDRQTGKEQIKETKAPVVKMKPLAGMKTFTKKIQSSVSTEQGPHNALQ